MQDIKENWKNVLNLMQSEVTTITFDLWVKTLEPIAIKDNCLIILANSEMAKKRCYELCADVLKLAVADSYNDVNTFKIVTEEEKEEIMPETEEVAILDDPYAKQSAQFNPKYTFESFVVGKSNEFVYAASRAVAEAPGKKFNPLFIYGGVGLGKTHLMHAIGNYIKQNNPDLKIQYVTCEQFTNDYIYTLRSKDKDMSSFRKKYRNLDVLMVDDIQSISNKKETQEEFFNTFNDLHLNGKQIVIASDRHPKEIPNLSDRLVSRCTMGLLQDIQNPDFETRVAILKRKAYEENYNVEDKVYTYLAEKVNTNIRELEGCLQKVHFYAGIHGKHFATMEDASEALQDEVTEKSAIGVDDILDAVSKYFSQPKDDITGKKKNKEFVEPRQVAIYLITELTDLPLKSIGNYFSGKDHTTIMHARDKIAESLKTNMRTKTAIEDLKSIITKTA